MLLYSATFIFDILISVQKQNKKQKKKKRYLRSNVVAALLREIHKVEDAGAQVGQGSDGLHLDRVAVLERVVEDTGRVDDLPAEVLVVHVADKERLGSEGVGLDVDVGTRDLVHERRLADVGETCDEERARVGVDRRQTRQMLAHLLEVREGVLLAEHERDHSIAVC